MKRFQVLKFIREKLVEKGITVVPNDGKVVRLFTIYDYETEVFNPPFSSDEISALNVFVHAVIDYPDREFSLYEIGVFDTDFGVFTSSEVLLCASDFVRSIIDENGGIEE